MATDPLTLQPGEHVWARLAVVDSRDHVYEAPAGAAADVHDMPAHPEWEGTLGVLTPAKGLRCGVCAAWAADHPGIPVRDTVAAREVTT